jgi:hypothetical protein
MPALTAHLAPFGFDMHRVVEDQVTCHNGCLGTPNPFGSLRFEALMFGLNQGLHSLPKALAPGVDQFFWRPRPLVQKPRQPGEADSLANGPQQAGHGSPFFTFDQGQQYDHEVLPLALGEAVAKGGQELA